MSRDLPYTVVIRQVPLALAMHQILAAGLLLCATVNQFFLCTVYLDELRELRHSRTHYCSPEKILRDDHHNFIRTVRSTHTLSSDIRNRCERIEKPPR